MKARPFSTFQFILLALFAGLIVAAKIALKTPIRLPGHSGLFWMALVVVAIGLVPRAGAGSLVGLTSGILAGFLGMGDFGALDTFLSYTAVGVAADLAFMLLRNLDNLVICALVGIIGHLGKFAVKWALGAATGATGLHLARPGGVLRQLRALWGARRRAGRPDTQGLRRGVLAYLAERR